MNKCETCKYFLAPSREKDIMGECENEKFIYTGGGVSEEMKDSLYYWDYEGYSAGFSVGLEFGCVHHKTK